MSFQIKQTVQEIRENSGFGIVLQEDEKT